MVNLVGLSPFEMGLSSVVLPYFGPELSLVSVQVVGYGLPKAKKE